ncbi:hypothetical protein [Exiguobacterium sp. RIT594]|uniref:hypothetical protein n=1 Tax=Exiguobacterium sp. RIT594 TaxID=2282449 RepID=UPI000DF80333|nr:hypothetical protein [Exiguobacterium sp. RIT594]RDB34300.1 hypothetical protein DVG79_06375 [Exiguobacterium sp. RIT594]
MKHMPMINRLLFAILLVYGTYLTLVDGPSPHSIILILVGISQLAIDLVFPAAETHDERQEAIKMKSGQMSYALSIVYMFAVVVLVQWGIIEDVLTALLCVLFIQVMTFPVTLFMYSRRS